MTTPIIAVLCGGTSSEREVSIGSGRACAIALARSFPTCLIDVTAEALPAALDRERHVVFSTLHGTFGEDGGMQRLLDAAGIAYAGCDATASALTMDKTRTKQAVAACGVRSPRGLTFSAANKPTAEQVMAELGARVVLKPNNEGSSVGLFLADDRAALTAALASATSGTWLAEERIVGRELSVGVLAGRAMGVVEIRPKSGVYDYASKYTKGLTEYLAPAPLADEVTRAVQQAAAAAVAACGGRDYARVDFLLKENNEAFFLEINTLPGMKETSLLPMSARVAGMDFTALVRAMVLPAVERFQVAKRA
ncbi:D-alanine--D-alanine ligase [Horticoccus luteus]|uniref:D-alanine--D-alanine ligase n=1 Tax=Horticoccus luteus TaxID=2862869 RepID=A0A8F9TUM0_9BACT|nr:D-alanine--D-alanine ligase [Horticoccus luteus]QYM78079.1 D-alanine--D-alanine ligase [Horticoccus luteus]